MRTIDILLSETEEKGKLNDQHVWFKKKMVYYLDIIWLNIFIYLRNDINMLYKSISKCSIVGTLEEPLIKNLLKVFETVSVTAWCPFNLGKMWFFTLKEILIK